MKLKKKSAIEFYEWISKNPLPGKHRLGAEKTIQGYARDLDRFAIWFKQTTDLELGAETLTRDDIQDFVTQLQTIEKKKASTVLRLYAAIRAYSLYLMETDDRVTGDRTAGVRLPRQEVGTKRALRRLERLAVGRVFTMPWKNTLLGERRLVRDKAIVYTMMLVGLRVAKLATLRLEDVKIIRKSTNSQITVRGGKGELDRTVAIPTDARDYLADWLELREELKKEIGFDHDFVFLQIRGKHGGLSVRSVQNVIEEVRTKTGIEDLTAHTLRHTAVRLWRRQAGDRVAAAQMGHSVTTMQKYDAVQESDLIDAAKGI